MSLNYKHLRYFWAVAHSGNLTRAAEQLYVSQSALSVQIRKLEEWLGHDLFERQGKRLVMTEAGRIALDHADTIFGVGDFFARSDRSSGFTGSIRSPGTPRRAGTRANLPPCSPSCLSWP